MDPGEFLRAHPPFDRLGAGELASVVEALQIVRQPAGARVLRQGGARSEYLYFIRSGAVRLERQGRVEQLLEAGDCFGFPSLIGRASPHADAVVAEEAVLYQLPASLFERLRGVPAFNDYFLLDLAERLRRAAAPSPLGLELGLPARALGLRPVIRVAAAATVGEAARRMQAERVSSVIVDGEAPAILTDRDLRGRVLAEGRGPETPAAEVASRPLRALGADASLYEALLFMLEHDVHHAPLSDGGALVGMLTHTDLLRALGHSPLGVAAGLERAEALSQYGDQIARTVDALASGGVEAAQIGRIVARLNDALTARLCRRAEAALGPPPVPYTWIVFGSEGRGEQALLTDQDNALVYRDDAAGAADYFAALAERVVGGLVEASFPRCPGGFMATNWRRSLGAWRETFAGWLERPEPAALRDVASLFDFRAVHGALSLAPLEALVRSAAKRPVFLAHLMRAALAFEPPLSALRQIREEDGGVELKRGGLLPIVGLARVFALEAGSPARGTLDRLAAAAAAGMLSAEGAATLSQAFQFLLGLRLRTQLAARRRGGAPDNLVPLDELSPLERRLLKDVFLAVRGLQRAAALRFDTQRLGA